MVTVSGLVWSTSANPTTVTGAGTSFLSQIQSGNALYSSSDTFIGTVSSVETDTSLTLQANAAVAITSSAFKYAPQQFPTVDTPVQIQDSLFTGANGGFLVETSAPASEMACATDLGEVPGSIDKSST